MAYLNLKTENPVHGKRVAVSERAESAALIIEQAETQKLRLAQFTKRGQPFFIDHKLIASVSDR